MVDTLATFLASFIIALVTGLVAYFKTNQKSASLRKYNQIQQDKLIEENVVLSDKVKNLTAVVEDLRLQVVALQHFKELYETLKEAHTQLKEDHEALRQEFQNKIDSWNTIKQDLERERSRLMALETEIEDLQHQLIVKQAEITAYERALEILGQSVNAEDVVETEEK